MRNGRGSMHACEHARPCDRPSLTPTVWFANSADAIGGWTKSKQWPHWTGCPPPSLLPASSGWDATVDELPEGVKLTVTSPDAGQVTKLKALGFMGMMVQGAHHQAHHLMMAKGEFTH
jgi:hypothetical protein